MRLTTATCLLDVCFEAIDLASLVVLFQVLNDLLHVALQVIGEGLLVGEAGLDKSMVEDDVDAGLGGLIGALVSLFSGGVGAIEDDLALLSGLVLKVASGGP